jgi:hypothetical protein
MDYTIKAHPTLYNHVMFRSRLEARWAAFFDLVEWEWDYEPIDFRGWTPDFMLMVPNRRGPLNSFHRLFVEVKPYFDFDGFEGHPCTRHWEDFKSPSSGALGNHPEVSKWAMDHGQGYCSIDTEVSDYEDLWREAGNAVRYQP